MGVAVVVHAVANLGAPLDGDEGTFERGRGIARGLIQEIVDIARATGLEKVEAEFIGGQETAIHMFAMLGFSELLRLENYVKDMQAIQHDYVMMGLDLTTDEEYTSAAG